MAFENSAENSFEIFLFCCFRHNFFLQKMNQFLRSNVNYACISKDLDAMKHTISYDWGIFFITVSLATGTVFIVNFIANWMAVR